MFVTAEKTLGHNKICQFPVNYKSEMAFKALAPKVEFTMLRTIYEPVRVDLNHCS